ncbi:hypothetical protein SDJN02_15943 [Cucurbita argyrosperma subsp. argyrosperma]
MGRSPFLSILLLSLLIAPCFTNGFGGKMRMMEGVDTHHGSSVELKESGEEMRRRMMMMETMDYSDPEPNTNVKGGGYVSPPPPLRG